VIQANQALPLYYGMVPEDKLESVQKSFLKSVENRRFVAGEVGLRYVFCMLAQMGRNDIVHDMILQPEHPSYYRFIQKGETTLPEFWNDKARSRNHDMMGHILQWFYEAIGGITSKDAFRNIDIHPDLVKDLTWVDCTYDSIRGKIHVKVEETKPGVQGVMEVTIPGNCRARIRVPERWKNWQVTCQGEDVNTGDSYILDGGTLCFMARKNGGNVYE